MLNTIALYMKKTIKKAVKKTKEIVSSSTPATPSNVCTACNGSGLWRPDFTNSPQCEVCKGHGVITK